MDENKLQNNVNNETLISKKNIISKEQRESIIPFGIPVWVHNKKGENIDFQRGYLRDANLGENVMVEFKSNKTQNVVKIKSYSKDKIGLIIDKPVNSPDLSLMDVCTPHGISHVLGERCSVGLCYTFSGNVLIFILPRAERIPRLMESYNSLEIQRYWTEMKTKFEPHIFTIARRSLISWSEKHLDQVIIIMGNKNTGKCFNLHMLIRFLARNLSLYKHLKSSYVISEKLGSCVHLIRSLTQTPGESMEGGGKFYNYGRSYSGQIWRIFIAREGCFLGLHIYLWSLNVTPLTCFLRENEGFFSIFYQLAHGMILDKNNSLIQSMKLTKSEIMIYLAQLSPKLDINYIDHLRGFKMSIGSLNSLGLNDIQKVEFFKIVMSVVIIDAYTSLLLNSKESDIIDAKVVFIPLISKLLGLEMGELEQTMKTSFEYIQLGVSIYCRLIDWISSIFNENLRPLELSVSNYESYIIIHGPGFNDQGYSLSNLLQNYSEEMIKTNYVDKVFQSEKSNLESEGLELFPLNYPDMGKIISVIDEKEKGILSLLRITSKRQKRVEDFISEIKKDSGELSSFHRATPCDEFGRIDLEPSRPIYSKLLETYPNNETLIVNEDYLIRGESMFTHYPFDLLQKRRNEICKSHHNYCSDRIRKYRKIKAKQINRADSKGVDLFLNVIDDLELNDEDFVLNSSVMIEENDVIDLPEYSQTEIAINHSFGKCRYNIFGMAEEDCLNQVPTKVEELLKKSKNTLIRIFWTKLLETDEKYKFDKQSNKTTNQKKKTKILIDEEPDIVHFELFWNRVEDFVDLSWMRTSAIPGSPSMSQIAVKTSSLLNKSLKNSNMFFTICASSFYDDRDTQEEICEDKIIKDLSMYNISSQVLLQQYGFTVKIPLKVFLIKFSEIYIPRIHKKGILEKLMSQDNVGDSVRTLLHGLEVPEVEYLIGRQNLFIRNKMILVLERRREEYLKKILPATIVLQNAWRTLKPRLFVTNLRMMSVRIQSLIRMRSVSLIWKKILPFRQLICGLALLLHLAIPWVKTSTIFDKLEELAQQREDERRFFRNCAATSIQAWWRGEMVRRRVVLYRYNEFREFSIEVIQSAWRTLKSQASLVEKLAFTKTPNYKAVKIQAVFRGWLVRKKTCKLFMLKRCLLSLKRKSIIRIGITKHIEYRGTLRRSHVFREQIRAHREVVNKAIVIQRVFRMALCRRQYTKLCYSAQVIQCRAYTCLEVYRYYKAIKSITLLQQWWRFNYILRKKSSSGDSLLKTINNFHIQRKVPKDPIKKSVEMNNLLIREMKQFDMMRYPLLSMQGLFQPLAKIVESNTVFLNPIDLNIIKDVGDFYPSTWGRGFVTLCRRLCSGIFEIAPTKQFPPLKILQFSLGQRHTLVLLAERILSGQGDDAIDLDSFDQDYESNKHSKNAANNGGALLGQTSGKLLNFEYRNHVYSWGVNDQGQLGLPILDLVSSKIKEPVKFIDYEYRYVKSGNTGKLMRYLIKQIDYTKRIRWVGCGSDYSMAITFDGKLFTWGDNTYGQCGHGHNYTYIPSPKIIEPLKEEQVYMASAGARHCGVVTQNGTVFMWGAGTHLCLEDHRFKSLYGHLEDYDMTSKISNFYEPFIVELPTIESLNNNMSNNENNGTNSNYQNLKSNKNGGIRHILCGNGFNMVCTNHLFIWGRNDKGQIGMNVKGHVLKPTVLQLPTVDLLKLEYSEELKKQVRRRSLYALISGNKITISSISAGLDFVCATIEDGVNVMYIWGNFKVYEKTGGNTSSFKTIGYSKLNLKSQNTSTISNKAIKCPTIIRHSIWENKILTQVACTVNSVAVITDDSELYGFEILLLNKTEEGKSQNISIKSGEALNDDKTSNWVGLKTVKKKQKDKIDKKITCLPESCKDLDILQIPEKHKNQLNDLFYFEPNLYQYRCAPNTKKAGLLTEEVLSSVSSTMSLVWVKHRRKTYVSQLKEKSSMNNNNKDLDMNLKESIEFERKGSKLNIGNSIGNDLLFSNSEDINSIQKSNGKNTSINGNKVLHRIQPKSYIPSYLFHDPQRVLGNGYGNDSVFVELLRRIKNNKNKKQIDDKYIDNS
ncbi:myosin fused to 3 IQ motifs (that interact with calmodulin) and Rcc1 domain [Cryptosporidium ryanae]|uniref:myosin fused to 3 IQ motifs (that interact with calmodulin) and Rcc1 domain n=1 Tax=Cryptosporidium ryanae TaxID=515981 RepID=UPI003519FDAB|nr:myosin fused to 3 IQ motifs (that interact with calmodulin) and Rcc1 domain [Cryptosporidium ryanae]